MSFPISFMQPPAVKSQYVDVDAHNALPAFTTARPQPAFYLFGGLQQLLEIHVSIAQKQLIDKTVGLYANGSGPYHAAHLADVYTGRHGLQCRPDILFLFAVGT